MGLFSWFSSSSSSPSPSSSSSSSSVADVNTKRIAVIGGDLHALLTCYFLLRPSSFSLPSSPSSSSSPPLSTHVTLIHDGSSIDCHWADTSIFSRWSSYTALSSIRARLLWSGRMMLSDCSFRWLQLAARARKNNAVHQSMTTMMNQSECTLSTLSNELNLKSNHSELWHLFSDRQFADKQINPLRQKIKEMAGINHDITIVNEKIIETQAPELLDQSFQFAEIGYEKTAIVLSATQLGKQLYQSITSHKSSFELLLNSRVKTLNVNPSPSTDNSLSSKEEPYHHIQSISLEGGKNINADAFIITDSGAMINLLGNPSDSFMMIRRAATKFPRPPQARRPINSHHEFIQIIPDGDEVFVSCVRQLLNPYTIGIPSWWIRFRQLFTLGTSDISTVPESIQSNRYATVNDAKELIERTHAIYPSFTPTQIAQSSINIRLDALTADSLPIVGRVPHYSNLYLNTGHAIHGLSSICTSQWISQLVLKSLIDRRSNDDQNHYENFSPARMHFPKYPTPPEKTSPIVVSIQKQS